MSKFIILVPFFLFAQMGAFVSLAIESDGGFTDDSFSSFGTWKIFSILSFACFYICIFLALVGVEDFYFMAKFSIAISTVSFFFYSGKPVSKIFGTIASLISAFALVIVILQYIAYAPLTKEIWMTVETLFLVCKFFLLLGVGNTKEE